MPRTLIGLSIILGIALADPIASVTTQSNTTNASVNITEETTGKRLTRQTQITRSLIYEFASTWMERYIDIHSLAKCVLNWFVSNALTVSIGALFALGFCWMTNKCSLQYETYIPISQLSSYITPDSLNTAENILLTALDKYQKS